MQKRSLALQTSAPIDDDNDKLAHETDPEGVVVLEDIDRAHHALTFMLNFKENIECGMVIGGI